MKKRDGKGTGMSKPPTRRHSQTCCRISTVLQRCRKDQLQREVPFRHRGDNGDGVNVGPNSCTAAAQSAGNDSNNKVHAAGPKSGDSIRARSVAEISEPVGCSNCGNSGNCPAIAKEKHGGRGRTSGKKRGGPWSDFRQKWRPRSDFRQKWRPWSDFRQKWRPRSDFRQKWRPWLGKSPKCKRWRPFCE